MNSELTKGRRRAIDEKDHDKFNAARKLSRRQTGATVDLYDDTYTIEEITIEGCWSFIQSPKVRLCILAIFTAIAMTIGILTIYFTTLSSGKACQLTFQRTMESLLVPSPQSRCIVTGNLNHDNQIDIVIVNSGTDSIVIFLSQGNGAFATPQIYSTGSGSRPYAAVLGHFNNDSYLDIAVANYGTNNVGIFIGTGNGTFTGQTIFSLDSSRPLAINVGDFNNDNRTDIVVANYGTNNVGLLLGYGNGSFQHQTTSFTGYDSILYSIAVADFNHDNQLDFVVANHGTNNAGLFFGYGNGTFADQRIFTNPSGFYPTCVTVGDFNNDSRIDIALSNSGIGNIAIFLGRGGKSFELEAIYSLGLNSYPQYITVGDLNNDNALDIIVADSQNDKIHIFPGYGNGTFATITTYDAVRGSSPYYVAVADLDNNNQSDIVVANYGTNNMLMLIGYYFEASIRQTSYDVGTPASTGGVAVSDFNNDDILDIVSFTNTHLIILTGLGNGIFSSVPTFSIPIKSDVQYIGAKDLNNDNRMDIVITSYYFNFVGVFLGYGNGTFATMTAYFTGTGSTPLRVAISDVNNDNQMDIISANTGTSTIGIFLGNGDGTFATMTTYSTGINPTPSALAVGDINHDNLSDIVVATSSNDVIIFIGYGNGSFIISGTCFMSPGSGTNSIVLADFNSDTHLDFVIAGFFSYLIVVYLGYGNGTFKTGTFYRTGLNSYPADVIVDDFNYDNIPDIAVSNQGTDGIIVFFGYGDGSFSLERIYSTRTGSQPIVLVAADLDNNKKLEIVVALLGPGSIAVLTEYVAAEFQNQIKYTTGSSMQPFSVAVSDFNNDNRSDVVVANSGSGNLGILLGMGNGTFGMEMIYPIGTGSDSYPQYVITCDINKDNHSDIISVNSKDNSISIIMGYGNGTFAEQLIYSTGDGSNPFSVALGNLNNDNLLDLVVANEGTDNIGILFGFDYTSFQNVVVYTGTNTIAPVVIVVTDLNNDNYLDIVGTFNQINVVGIFLGYGNGTFHALVFYETGDGSSPWGLAAGDFNNDNNTDIVTTNTGTNTITVWLGSGDGYMPDNYPYATGENSYPLFVAVGDVNNDSQLDIVVANMNTNNVGVLLGYGNADFSIIQTYFTGENSGPSAIALDDFNNDSRLDIVVANAYTNNIGILLGYGDGTFGDQTPFSTGAGSGPGWVAVGYFNSDNHLDIAAANWNSNNIAIFLGYGNGTFADMIPYSSGPGSIPASISVGDFNNDKISDIVVANFGTDSIVVLFGVGDGSFLLGTPSSTGIGSKPLALAIGDFNNDTRLDVTVANNHGNSTGILLGYGNQPFAGVTTYSTGAGSQPHSVAVTDFNNDGKSDIVVANYGTDNVGVLLGRNNGGFGPMVIYLTGNGSAPYSVTTADFNHDQYLDIIVTNSDTDNIAIFLGYGNGTFANGVTYSTGTGSRPYIATITDFNNDNISDIAIVNSGTSNIYLLFGYGNGTFGNDTFYPLGYEYQPYSVAVSDLNEDSWTDIVIACYGTNYIELLMKMC